MFISDTDIDDLWQIFVDSHIGGELPDLSPKDLFREGAKAALLDDVLTEDIYQDGYDDGQAEGYLEGVEAAREDADYKAYQEGYDDGYFDGSGDVGDL